MKKINITSRNAEIRLTIETINELLEELAKKGIIELEDDNNGSSKD